MVNPQLETFITAADAGSFSKAAVSIYHPLAAKTRLRIEDLYGQNLLMVHRNWSKYVDELRDELWQEHPQVEHHRLRPLPHGGVQLLRKRQRRFVCNGVHRVLSGYRKTYFQTR